MTRDERIKLIEPILSRVLESRLALQRLFSDLDAGHLPDAVFGSDGDVGLYDLIGVAAKRLSQAADMLKDAAVRKDDAPATEPKRGDLYTFSPHED